ncbi:polysaccharide biosynthesis C-terminal domain-containing protein [Bifidobacterium sp. MA2]|uniref:Polysaccharide biosynthesis C-terminal domain-containing protein n=1 Tax=Bifidobacterium santillanense TaxID=2809028 RepID=A0ABS5URR6_9BIFI|nr:MATE family efflux transporter [Bifidobacterium santillanense]MBT1173521.1 polysaccharide biosynthesis C-terminal domain-containing protein [Bifidobacterium santillanense]
MRRGLLLNLISNVVFFVSGYALHFFLGNTMPPAAYGVVGTIITVLDFEYMFVSNGARQSVASEISRKRYDFRDVVGKTLAFQLIVVAFFFCVNFLGAPLFGIVLNDATLDRYFRIAAFLVVVNGLQTVLLGVNDGLQRFGTSALLSTFYPIAKLGVIPLIIFVFRDDPVIGVEVGFLLAVVLTILLGCALLFVRRDSLPKRRSAADGVERIPFGYVATHTLSFSFFFIMVSLVLSVDTLIVKAVVEPASMAGYYTGAMNFGKIAYYLLQAFSTVILPVVAKLVGEGRRDAAVTRTGELLLIAFVFILPISVVVSASSGDLLAAFYSPSFDVAAATLSCLSFSNFFMGITVILNMVLNSFGSSRFSDVLSIVSLVVVIPVFIVSARTFGITGIAVASVTCTGLAMLVTFARTYRKVGNVMLRRTWIVLGANVVLWVLVHVTFVHFNVAGQLTLESGFTSLPVIAVLYAAIYVAYLAVLFAAKVITVQQLKVLGK